MTTTNTTSSTSTQSTMSAKEFRQKSYDAYIAYVHFIEGSATGEDTVTALAPLFAEYGFTLTQDNLARTLTLRMTAYGKLKGEDGKSKNVKSIGTFRNFIKGGWRDIESAPVHYNAGKTPVETRKSLTKKELEELVYQLMAEKEARENA